MLYSERTMPNKQITIDPSADSQVIDQPDRRTIYDAGVSEIFVKSFVAGIGLGIGRMLSTLIFFGIIAGLFVTYLEPWLMGFINQLEDSVPSYLLPIPSGSDASSNRFEYNDNQILDIFNTFRPEPTESTPTTETTTL